MIKNITVIGGGSTGHAAAAIYSNKGFYNFIKLNAKMEKKWRSRWRT